VAIDALANGLVEVAQLVSDTFDLSDGLRALERAAEPGVMKVLLDASDGRGVPQQPPQDLPGR
jgi:threonine dehydrogenase-like Zn-dependent dehydrogenase